MSSTQGPSRASVVLVSQFFHPDTSANATVLSELAVGLADRGVDVSVVTTQPSYASDDRETTAPKREIYEGVSVRRLPATRFNRNDGLAKRLLNELSFFFVAFLYLVVRRRGDVLLLPTAPTFLPIAGWLLRWRGYRPVPIVMDLYPAMAVALGYLDRTGPLTRLWEWLNRRLYRTASVTVTIGETMAEELRTRYGDIDVEVIHNWEDGAFIEPKEKSENSFAQDHGFNERFTLLYSGNLGRHHDLESLVEAAAILEDDETLPPFEFVIIGDGAKKEQLQDVVAQRGIDSVRFLPYQPVNLLPQSLTSGDVSIVTMAEGVEGLCVSSKFYSALASGQAVLAISAPNTEIARVVERTNCGVHVEPNSPNRIAESVRRWLEDQEAADAMGDRARKVFETEFEKTDAIDAYYSLILQVAENT